MISKKTVKSQVTATNQNSKNKYFPISIKLLPTNEIFPVPKVCNEMKMKELKALSEFYTGIPYHMQILRYLDEGMCMYIVFFFFLAIALILMQLLMNRFKDIVKDT